MTDYNARILDAKGNAPVWGDHARVIRPVTNIPAGDSLSKAWLTVKTSPATQLDAAAALQLEITSVLSADGQITDTGAGDTIGSLTFKISGLDYDELEPTVNYYYDIAVLTAAGVRYTLEIGRVTWAQEVTRATA